MAAELLVRFLGRVDFRTTWVAQTALAEAKAADPEVPDELWLLTHDPVYTIGKTPDRSSLGRGTPLPHPVVTINRGGQATYHGPGQLIGYPLLDLRRHGKDLHRYLRTLEAVLIEVLAGVGVAACRRPGLTGVWVADRKIASLGVGVRNWISMHGFALNVGGDLTPFQAITPCGIAGVTMTSVERETGRPATPETFVGRLPAPFARAFGYPEPPALNPPPPE